MDDLERCQREFLKKILRPKVKSSTALADVKREGRQRADPMQTRDLLDGLPIPCGEFLLVNPFV
jgi:hypothetical protein